MLPAGIDLESELSPETLAALKEFLLEREATVQDHHTEDWECVFFPHVLSTFSSMIRLAQFWV